MDSIPGVWALWETGTCPIASGHRVAFERSASTRVKVAIGVSSYTILYFFFCLLAFFFFALFNQNSENNKLLKAWVLG